MYRSWCIVSWVFTNVSLYIPSYLFFYFGIISDAEILSKEDKEFLDALYTDFQMSTFCYICFFPPFFLSYASYPKAVCSSWTTYKYVADTFSCTSKYISVCYLKTRNSLAWQQNNDENQGPNIEKMLLYDLQIFFN